MASKLIDNLKKSKKIHSFLQSNEFADEEADAQTECQFDLNLLNADKDEEKPRNPKGRVLDEKKEKNIKRRVYDALNV